MTTAVVANAAHPFTNEEQLVARRIAGVLLGTGAELRVADPAPPAGEVGLPGRGFAAVRGHASRRVVLESSLFGSADPVCACPTEPTDPVSPTTEAAWLETAGGRSDDL